MTDTTAHAETLRQLQRLPRPALWLIAARMKTLGLSIVPVIAASWAAAQAGSWRLDVMLAAMISASMIQIGTNLWNDAADGGRGGDGPGRLGPARMTGLGLLNSAEVRRAARLAFLASSLTGLYLAFIGGWPIIAIGLVSLALGYFYSMGPRPLSHTPLGEVLVILFFGVVAVGGTVYLHGQPITARVLTLGVVIGLPAAAVLLLNNHRDRAQDVTTGRRTLAILVGIKASRTLFGLLLATSLVMAVAYSSICTLSLVAFLPATVLGAVLALSMARTEISRQLNRLIAGTAMYQALLLAGMAATTALCG